MADFVLVIFPGEGFGQIFGLVSSDIGIGVATFQNLAYSISIQLKNQSDIFKASLMHVYKLINYEN